MADNYLERKMEELRRNPQKTVVGSNPVPRKGFVQFAFPQKRVLIASDTTHRNTIARIFLKADCKVAMMHPFHDEGKQMAYNEGVRYYPTVDEEAFLNLLSAWRDVDIVITDKATAIKLIPIWRKHRELFPYVSSYVCRLIIFGDAEIAEIRKAAQGIKTTVNIFINPDSQKDLPEQILSLSLPCNDILDGLKL